MDSTHSISRRNFANTAYKTIFLLAAALPIAVPTSLRAQTAGAGTITGTVNDSTGAAIPNATVVATNTATNVSSQRASSSSGLFNIAPLPPGTYSVSVQAPGFRTLKQDNLVVNALGVLGFNPVLTIGEAAETVEVTAAPPVLNTTNATVGLVMENTT
jgi:hypothetical protein